MSRFNPAPALAGLTLALSAASAHAGVLANGDFATGIAPWTTSGGIGAGVNGGRALIEFGTTFGDASGTFSQTFVTSQAGQLDYVFDLARSEAFCGCMDVALTFEARVDGVVLSSSLPAFDPDGSFSPAALSHFTHYAGAVSLAAGDHAFSFTFTRGPSLFGRDPFFGLDGVDATLTPAASPTPGVPEPASWALMIAGFGLAGAMLRRRRPATA
jgi:hypothetical protein